MGKFVVSVSALSRFFGCPASQKFHTELEPLVLPSYVTDGLEAHAILAGEDVASSPRAHQLAKQLKLMEENGRYKILDREVRQYVSLTTSITLVRVIDVLAKRGNTGILLDYKASGSDWDMIGNVAPKAAGLQAAGYLIPPDDPAPYKTWPKRIDFLVARPTMPAGVFPYTYNQDDVDGLIAAAEIFVWSTEKGYFPKLRGSLCKWCFFKDVCYEVKGWEGRYEVKNED